jgi:chromosome segregation ATPase
LKTQTRLPHGDYLPWIEANMPVNERQCQKFVRLAKERPELLEANTKLTSYLELDSELMLLAFSEYDQAKIRDFAKEEDLSQKQIKELTDQLKAAQDSADEWRLQDLDKRDKLRIYEQTIQNAKPDIIYITDTDKALQQYKAEVAEKMSALKKKLKKEQEDKLIAIKKVRDDIHSGYDKEINNKQKQELSLNHAIELAQQKMSEIDSQLQPRIAYAEAIKNFRHYLNCLAVEASIVYDQDCNEEERTTLLELFRDNRIMLDGCENELSNAKPNLRIV